MMQLPGGCLVKVSKRGENSPGVWNHAPWCMVAFTWALICTVMISAIFSVYSLVNGNYWSDFQVLGSLVTYVTLDGRNQNWQCIANPFILDGLQVKILKSKISEPK